MTAQQVGDALARLGNYRVVAAQVAAGEGPPDGIGGHHLLALGLRETGLRNIEGGAKWDGSKWVAQDDPTLMDVGCFQISRHHHSAWCEAQPGCPVGSWSAVTDRSAYDRGYVPRFTPALSFTLSRMKDARQLAATTLGLGEQASVRFAIAAHNAGTGGATKGQREGNVDRYTAGGDYSAWVLEHAKLVKAWLEAHPNWQPS